MPKLLHNYSAALRYGAKILPSEILDYTGAGFTGNVWYVKPYSGSDSASGETPAEALKTLKHALSVATANNNDVIYLISESNTASATTDYQSSTLLWNKDLTHLIGVAAPTAIEPRARIAAASTATGVAPTMTVSANGCYIANVEIYGGVTSDATSFGSVQVTGSRNLFDSVHFAGIGGSDAVTSGAYNVKFHGATECVFDTCTFGNDNVINSNVTQGELFFDTTSSKIKFRDCNFEAFISNAGYLFMTYTGTTSIDRWVDFDRCRFQCGSTNDATALTQAFGTWSGSQGYINVSNCTLFSPGATTAVWTGTGSNRVKIASGPAQVKTGGEGVIVN